MQENGLPLKALTVLAHGNDPFSIGTLNNHRDGRWFAEQLMSTAAIIHLRGLHYVIVARADVRKPRPNDRACRGGDSLDGPWTGEVYVNSAEDWEWLLEDAAKSARWLGYVPFDRLRDNRAGEPIIKRRALVEPEALIRSGLAVVVDHGETVMQVEGADDGLPLPELKNFRPRQKYVFAIFGEKSSLFGEIDPVAEWLEADLYLETGEQSISHAYDLAYRAALDGRTLVVVTITDFDPAGRQMTTSIARKLRAFHVLMPRFKYRLIEAGVTYEQATRFDLPSTPLKETEKRKDRWLERFGREQTELDAMLALHPGELSRAVEEKLTPYFDDTLAGRTVEAEADWREEVETRIAEKCGEEKLAGWRGRYAAALAEIATVNDEIEEAVADVDLEPPDLPEAEPDDDEDDGRLIASSAWSFVEETLRLKARKALEDEAEEWCDGCLS
jgi:hypothetical protein